MGEINGLPMNKNSTFPSPSFTDVPITIIIIIINIITITAGTTTTITIAITNNIIITIYSRIIRILRVCVNRNVPLVLRLVDKIDTSGQFRKNILVFPIHQWNYQVFEVL